MISGMGARAAAHGCCVIIAAVEPTAAARPRATFSVQPPLKRRLAIALTSYCIWVAYWLWVTIKPVGDGGVAAHLWLTITGFPTAFESWMLPHGSVLAVTVAGVLGAVQLVALVGLLARKRSS